MNVVVVTDIRLLFTFKGEGWEINSELFFHSRLTVAAWFSPSFTQKKLQFERDEAAGGPEPLAAAPLPLRRVPLHLRHLPACLHPQLDLHARRWERLRLGGGSSPAGEGALADGTSRGTLQGGELREEAGDVAAAWAVHPGQDVRVRGKAVPTQGLSGNQGGHQ